MGKLENIQHIATSDSITLYWDKPEGLSDGCQYQILVNDEMMGSTSKTHYTICGLVAKTEYLIQVKQVKTYEEKARNETEKEENVKAENVKVNMVLHELAASDKMYLYTGKEKKLLDVTKSPYNAKGDGLTMNTKAIQQAFDDCKENETVYLPVGVFMTGALRMHSDMELYLEEGAVLQGTDVVEDYLPRIKSRFEGIENQTIGLEGYTRK